MARFEKLAVHSAAQCKYLLNDSLIRKTPPLLSTGVYVYNWFVAFRILFIGPSLAAHGTHGIKDVLRDKKCISHVSTTRRRAHCWSCRFLHDNHDNADAFGCTALLLALILVLEQPTTS